METLNFDDVVGRWRRVNTVVEGYSFISALWNYCKETDVNQWRRVFVSRLEQMKIVNMFYDHDGCVLVKGKRLFAFADLRDKLIPYFNNPECQEVAFIASLLVKFFDLMYPWAKKTDNRLIIGVQGVRAVGNLITTSRWCLQLDAYDFAATDEPYPMED